MWLWFRLSFVHKPRMKTLPFSKIRIVVIIASLVLVAGGIGYQLGERRVTIGRSQKTVLPVLRTEAPPQIAVDFSLFWDVWGRLNRYYIDKTKLDAQKMVWGAISGMVNALDDPYTAFLPPKENKDFKEDLGGAFEGIGAQLGTKESHIIVIAPLKGMPAEKAGIRAGDWVLKVNNEETVGWTVVEAVTKIRGPRGTPVTLTILHEKAQKTLDVTVVRDTITVSSVESWIKPPAQIAEIQAVGAISTVLQRPEEIAYLHLSRFGDHSNQEWEKAVSDIVRAQKEQKVKGVIFDLRNNPGGYLDGAVFIASEFLKQGTVVSQVNSDGSKEEYPVNRRGQLLDIPLVVLINKGSASASEIVAGALRDHKRATLIGETSFGKGTVQTPQDLAGGASIHITTGKWLLPNGDSIHKVGIKPDIAVASEETDATRDGTLARAVEFLLQ